MNTLAFDGGPGPWILFFPLVWAAVILAVVTLLRRTAGRGRALAHRGPWRAPLTGRGDGGPAHDERSPIALLGRRFAAGEIDEDEYWRRLSVLDEQFGRTGKGGGDL
ncbi:SHOCT domain-containing protein [Streptomyces liangshanensis]|uniref:SHOCT domain-containing protein n=1 Tax=Streptomyces liangshanensis TaxID=2717324 RepID=A0A6G9H717_9ACTN|nr:SHOCT domain-containing protein [Streptomyces liangshanensis]QIQ06244.1 SHOCT domain-containing protein [Streptomyces liangshanensis]